MSVVTVYIVALSGAATADRRIDLASAARRLSGGTLVLGAFTGLFTVLFLTHFFPEPDGCVSISDICVT